MRYLFVHSAQEWSGTARVFTVAARELAQRGHTVSFVVEPESTVEHVVSQAVTIPGKAPLVDVEPLTLRGTWFGAARRLRSFIKRRGIEVVFVHTNREQLIAAFACWTGRRARVVRRVPAGVPLAMKRSGRVATWLTPTYFMFTSEADAQAGRLPRRAAGSVVVPLGTVIPAVNQTEEPSLTAHESIVCLHDATSRSRAATAIRTLAMLMPRHPHLRLIIIGEGIYDDDLRMQAAARRVLHRVTFLGDRDDALQVMQSAWLGWVVAEADTAACGVLDFMALGVPVLSGEKSEAEQYVLSEITGVLLPSDDAHLTAAAVAGLLANEAQRETMGEAAQARVAREFPQRAMIDGFERTAAQLAERRRR